MEKVELKQRARRTALRLVLPLLLISTAFTLTRPEPHAQASAEAQIRQALADWVKATNEGDRQRANSIWAKDLIGWYPGQPDDTYEKEMQAAARPQSGKKPRTTTAVTINEVLVSSDMAVVRDTWTFTQEGSGASDANSPDVIRSFEVWRKQADGSWKIARWISAPEPKQH
jgi:ketosteroid isomerase-like protein